MKVAIVGCGNISRLHFAAVSENPNTELVAAVDIKPERANHYAEKYGIKAYTSYDEMLDSEAPDCVHICTPHYLHTPYAVKALNRNINVLCEKPCSVNDAEVEALRAAQKASNAHYGVCFQNRYNLCVGEVLDTVKSGELGKVEGVRAFVTWNRGSDYYSDDWHGTLEKECGCLLINQCIHTLDLIQLIGGGCDSLIGHISNDHLQGVIEGEDTASLLIDLNCGAKAVFYGTTAHSCSAPVIIEVAFTNGTLRCEGEKLFKVSESGIEEIKLEKRESLGRSYWGSGHASLISDFYNSIINNTPFAVDSFAGGEAAKMVFAAYRSAGKKVYLK